MPLYKSIRALKNPTRTCSTSAVRAGDKLSASPCRCQEMGRDGSETPVRNSGLDSKLLATTFCGNSSLVGGIDQSINPSRIISVTPWQDMDLLIMSSQFVRVHKRPTRGGIPTPFLADPKARLGPKGSSSPNLGGYGHDVLMRLSGSHGPSRGSCCAMHRQVCQRRLKLGICPESWANPLEDKKAVRGVATPIRSADLLWSFAIFDSSAA